MRRDGLLPHLDISETSRARLNGKALSRRRGLYTRKFTHKFLDFPVSFKLACA